MVEAGAALRARKISVRELVDEALRKIAGANPRLNAFITVTEDLARARADALDQELAHGIDRGPLHGIPIAHKDCLFTKGVRTTWGSRLFADFIPGEDAEVVATLAEAGCVMVGKTGLHEFTYGITSTNPHFGPVRNPWDTERIPGGSSGGSGAAVAAALVPFATGTDTGGSIRVPASFCGVVGLKPTFDRISRRGCLPLGLTLDHVGPMTRTVRDAAAAFSAMAGIGASVPPAHAQCSGLRIGVPQNFFFDRLDAEVNTAARRTIRMVSELGARVREIPVPDPEALNVVGRVVLLAEAAAVLGRYLDRLPDIGSDVRVLLEQGRLVPATEYIDAQRVRRVLAREFDRVWSQIDILITPATPVPASKIGETQVPLGSGAEDVRVAATRFSRCFNVLGWPALVMPCGFTSAGLPIGLQLIAAPMQEDKLLNAAAVIEDALGLTARRPA
jgi:aspartyl-tRNA(Asn)/glutamyl-tRNA(Gln) amidotransferase subunit A